MRKDRPVGLGGDAGYGLLILLVLTLAKRKVAPGSAYIKTGLLNNVKSAGGMVQARSGKRYAIYAVVQGKNATKTDAPIDRLIEWVYFNG